MEIISSWHPSGMLSPMEQVFSNHLLVSLIWKYFNTQDLLRTSLVSVSWFARSREYLKIHGKSHPVCVQISHESPCRQLKKFNEFLEETDNGVSSNEQIIFNGIQFRPLALRGYCKNCLEDEWEATANKTLMARLTSDRLLRKNLLMTYGPYGQVLEKIKFRYIFFQHNYVFTCPAAKFVKWVLKNRPEDILELDLKQMALNRQARVDPHNNISYFGDENHSTALRPTFPNLTVLGLPEVFYMRNPAGRDHGLTLPIVAPSLKRIKHLVLKDLELLSEDVPLHAITRVSTGLFSEHLSYTLNVVSEFHPKIEDITLIDDCHGGAAEFLSFTQRCSIFKLGRRISPTLTSLTCSFPCFTFISSICAGGADIMTNSFPRLQCLNLRGRLGVDFIDWSNGKNFQKEFPKLTKVTVTYDVPVQGPRRKSLVNGPFNRVSNVQWETVEHLIVRLHEDEQHSRARLGVLPTLLSLFTHVRHLDLRDLRSLTCSAHDKAFGEVMSELGNLLHLEGITVRLNTDYAMRTLCLDHLFGENISAVRDNLAGRNLEDLTLYKTSVLNHSLKRINIFGFSICTKLIRNREFKTCRSEQLPGIFLVTTKKAELICKRRPGFRFRVHLTDIHMSQCKCDPPGGFRLEHLKTNTIISTDDSSSRRDGDYLYDIEFRS